MSQPPPTPQPAAAILSRTTLHKGRKFDYEQLVVRAPSGRTHTRELVRHPGAVVIVPILEPEGGGGGGPRRVVLIRVYRASIDAMNWECCAGTLEKGEDPAACAARELIEETGYSATTLTPLGTFLTSPGLSDEWMHAFAATGLEHVGQDLEEDEQIDVQPVDAPEALAMIDRGVAGRAAPGSADVLADAKSMTAVLLAHRRGLLG